MQSDDKPAGTENEELEALVQKVQKARGLDLSEYIREKIRDSVQERLKANNLTSYKEYMELLDRQPDEYEQLFNVLLTDRYNFFFDPEVLEVLKEEIIPQIIANKRKGSPIRVWSATCAEGSEPYSIGIMLAEKLGDSFYDYNIRIYATDTNGNEVTKARTGAYHMDRLKNIRKEDLGKYFIPENSGYLIRTDIRQRVIFSRQNLTVDAPFYNIDLIIYRYALIYYDIDQQNKILNKLHFALNNNGYVVFGRHETTPRNSKLFKPVHGELGIYQKATQPEEVIVPRAERREILEDLIIERAAREAKRELEAMDLYSRGIIQNLNFGLIVIDINNIVTHWNRAAGEIWLIKPEEATGKSLYELGINERIPGILQKIEEAARFRKTIRFEATEVTDFKGEKRLMDIVLTPLIDQTGEMRGIIITSIDTPGHARCREDINKLNEEFKSIKEKLETTNKKLISANYDLLNKAHELDSTKEEIRSLNEELGATRDELRAKTERFNSRELLNKTILQNINQSLIELDENHTVRLWNTAAERIWGIKEHDAVGKNIFDLSLGIEAEVLKQKIEGAREKRTIYREEQLEYTAPSDEKRLIELTVVPLIDIEGKPRGALLLVQDITERRSGQGEER